MKQTLITSNNFSLKDYLRRIYYYRSIIYLFAIREIKVKYAQTLLGLLWAIIQPLTGIAAFSFFFSILVDIDTGNTPYPLIALTGALSWNFFSFLVNNSGTSITSNQNLIKKISFPKINLLLAKVLLGLLDYFILLVILFLWIIIKKYPIDEKIFFIPVILFFNVLAGLTISLWISALTIRYRDMQHIIPFLVNAGFWITPVFYPSTLMPQQLNFIIYLNPMAGIIESLRYATLHTPAPDIKYLWGMGLLIVFFFIGFCYFKNTEKKIPDYI